MLRSKWFLWLIAALAVIGIGVFGYTVLTGSEYEYSDEPGIVYENDGDGHEHDHGYFGVE